MFLLLLIFVSAFAERQIWSHRCRQSKYPENDIDACRLAAEIFDGIEVDVHWHDATQSFWMHHDQVFGIVPPRRQAYKLMNFHCEIGS